MTIKIVTDSTCDLPHSVIRDLGITVIPLYINIDNKGYLDGVDLTREDFYQNLPFYENHPTTGTPGIGAFTKAYKDLFSNGATEILSIHFRLNL